MKNHHIKQNILCRLLIAVFVISASAGMFGISVSADEFEDVNAEYQYSDAIDVLSSLGIFSGMEDGKFYPENKVTRAEFAAIVIRALNLENVAQSADGEIVFTDVKDHWARGYINLASQLGYLSGKGDSKFYPDENITFEQAVKVMVCITGFQPYAESRGGYPAGYVNIAGENKIIRNIAVEGSTALTRGQIAQLLFDTMHADMLKGSGTIKSGYETLSKEGSLMDAFSDYADEKGIVASVRGTSIDQQSGTDDKDYVVIRTKNGDLRVNIGTTNAQELLGCEVNFYTDVSEQDDYTLLYIKPTDNNKTLTINSEDIDKVVPEDSYSYYVDGKSRKANLDRNVFCIYNGEYADDLTDEEWIPADGSVTLLDNDSDGRYDIVFINSYQHLLVSEYSVKDGIPKLYFRPNTQIAMGQLEMDPDDRDSTVTVYRDGNIIIPDEKTVIKKWTAASVAQSKSKETTIVYLSEKSVSGKLNGISNDDEGQQYSIDGVNYYLARSFNDNVKMNDYKTFLLSFDDRIVGINTDSDDTVSDYALVLRTIYNSDNEEGSIKLLHTDGTTETHTVANNLMINNVRTKEMSESVLRTIETYSLIVFSKDSEGNIRKIETADKSNVCTTTGGYIDYNEDKVFSLNASTDLYFNDVNPPTLGGDMKLDKNTIVFDISSNDKDEWGTGDYSLFNDDTVYTVDAYDLDEFKVAGVVVSHGTTLEESDDVNWAQSPLLIEKVSLTINEDDETTYGVRGMMNGEYVTLMAKDTEVTDDENMNYLADMTPGSVIQIKRNLNGNITKIRKLYKAPSKGTVYDTMEIRDWSGSDYNVKLHTVYGMCINANENILTVATRMNDECRAYSITGANIYIYHEDTRTAEKGSIYDIKPGSSYGYSDCSRVFMRMEKDMVRDIVIYDE